jgi:tetratricopeptide (TPR) repeat protein
MKKFTTIICAITLSMAACIEAASADATLDDLLQHASEQISGLARNHDHFLNRAELQIRDGNLMAALNDIEAAEKISDGVEVAYVYGLYLVASEDYLSAVGAFSDYLARYPGHTDSIHRRARAHTTLGLTDQAIWGYQYLLNVSQAPSPDYYLDLARLEALSASCGIESAIKTLDRGMAKLGLLVSLQTAAIQYETERGNYQYALERLLTLKPWLAKTPDWQLRHEQLTERLSATVE